MSDVVRLLHKTKEVFLMGDKRISFRLDDKGQFALDRIRENMSKQAMVNMNESQVIRACIAMAFNQVFDGTVAFEDLDELDGDDE